MSTWQRVRKRLRTRLDAQRVLVLVAALYALMQVIVIGCGRWLAYDEAVYLAQVYPDVPELAFSAPRARGLVWLVAPMGLWGAPIWAIRVYLVGLSSGLLFVAFRVWIPLIGARAVWAAAAFATFWLPMFYGNEIYPNLYVALGAVAATGYLARHLTADSKDAASRVALYKAGVAVTAIALIRPPDALVICGAMGICAITANTRLVLRRWSVLGGAFLVGLLPWIVEAYVRFGGVTKRLAAASANVGGGFHLENLGVHLALADGSLASSRPPTYSTFGIALWALLGVGAIAAIVRLVGRKDPVPLAGFVGLAAVYPYVATEVATARFLLPSYALLLVGFFAVIPLPPRNKVATLALAGLLFAGWTALNIAKADSVARTENQVRARSLRMGEILRRRSPDRPCYFASQHGFPQISFASGCIGARYRPDKQLPASFLDSGKDVLVLTRRAPDKISPVPALDNPTSLADEGVDGWWIYAAKTNPRVD